MDETGDTVWVGGTTISRRLQYESETNLRPDQPPVEVEGYEVLDDAARVTEIHVTLRVQPGEPGLTAEELGRVNLAALHHNRVLFEVWKRRATITLPDDLDETGLDYWSLVAQRKQEAEAGVRAASKSIRRPGTTPERLAEVLEAFETNDGGIKAVMKLGYSRSQAYKLLKAAREEGLQ
jgi:hypothetical protein